jgi:Sulfotransferase family
MSEMQQTPIPEPRGLGAWAAGWRNFGDGLSRRLWLLQSGALCAEARRRSGLEDFGEPPIEPAASILTNSLERQADLHPVGRFLMWIHLRELLETRLRVVRAWSGMSEALEGSHVQRPVFITGMPRSGSTFLHELMAEDPQNRAPRVWEVMFPIPAHSGSPREADRWVRKAEISLWWFRRLAPRADWVYPMRARTPHECVAIHSYTLMSEEFASTCRIPTYENFLRSTDLVPTYSWQKRFLQYLQLRCKPRQWVLKSPDHVRGLPYLFAVFPDAVIIQTHRDPLGVLRSSVQLAEVLEGLFTRVGDRGETGLREARTLAGGMQSMMLFRESHPELAGRFIDVNYEDLVSKPLPVIHRIYRQLDMPLTDVAAERMQRLASTRSPYRGRRANPSLADLGLDESVERRRFEAYCSQFDIHSSSLSLRRPEAIETP